MEAKVYNKSKKVSVHWCSRIPTKYKRDAITGELHRAKRIANDFNFEVKRITKKKFIIAGFPRNSIRNTTEYFSKNKNEFIITEWLFDERKLIILRILFSESNEQFTESFIKKIVIFTNNKRKFNIVWNTRNVRSLFKIKGNLEHYSL